MIVMFNLLIAIISESFANINSNSVQASNQERAKIIAENAFLVPDSKKAEISDPSKYLIVAREAVEEEIGAEELSDLLNQTKTDL